jgi:hypothetical protein
MVDDALAAEIDETATEVGREVEALKDAAGLESAQIIEEYRATRVARRDSLLALDQGVTA